MKTENSRLRFEPPSTSIAQNRQRSISLGVAGCIPNTFRGRQLDLCTECVSGAKDVRSVHTRSIQISSYSPARSDLKFNIQHYCGSVSLVFMFIWSKLMDAGQKIYQVAYCRGNLNLNLEIQHYQVKLVLFFHSLQSSKAILYSFSRRRTDVYSQALPRTMIFFFTHFCIESDHVPGIFVYRWFCAPILLLLFGVQAKKGMLNHNETWHRRWRF